MQHEARATLAADDAESHKLARGERQRPVVAVVEEQAHAQLDLGERAAHGARRARRERPEAVHGHGLDAIVTAQPQKLVELLAVGHSEAIDDRSRGPLVSPLSSRFRALLNQDENQKQKKHQ